MSIPSPSVTEELSAWMRGASDGNGVFKHYKGECAVFTCRECQAVLNQPTETFYKKGQKDFYTGKELTVPDSLKAWAKEHKHSLAEMEFPEVELKVKKGKAKVKAVTEPQPVLSLPQPVGRKFRD